MTRWKRERTATLVLMHRHNQWSMWCEAKVQAAARLGLPVSTARYFNCSGDGSIDVEWYTSAAALDARGGMSALETIADAIHTQLMGGKVT